ncbi:ABC transporter ATP-binding protein [Halocalculus aciditolerans]|uniref:ABC transporter domain-containing protein n=1 Tax=Halocalculus aciditolerans TaxID=1383812 RepID=A0A830F485_9EURY|nr:oligopeptide/dipeptide ABC transporter ATP-binding protein [Halocalculus aciditolerans]GGL61184.1 hypothetical protein GCM10009039_19190 [Halocalculus aciditolerans]
MSADSPILRVNDLKKYYERSGGVLDSVLGGPSDVRAVDGVDLTVRDGETVAVVGESGCGKSTLARTVLNLETVTGGTIEFRGDDITGLSGSDMRPYRREMQMVFQDPLASLNPRKTVRDILTTPMAVHDIGDSQADRVERAKDLLERVGLKDSHIDRYPHQFSGGQQQRVGIARALAVEPELIVADEPVSALDVSVQAQLLGLLDELKTELGLSLLFISHDLSVVQQVADRVAVMYLGEIVEVAPTRELFANPQHPYTQALLSAVPRIDPDNREDRVLLEGTVPSPANPPAGCRFHTRCPQVIPGDGWQGSQEAFRDAFRFRSRVEAGELDAEAARTRLESEGQDASDDAVADYLVESSLDHEVDALPADAANAVTEAARALVDDDEERAVDVVQDAFPSPCAGDPPEASVIDTDHTAACHRLTDDYPDTPE